MQAETLAKALVENRLRWLKYAGISAVIAQSFARIFYRNSFTIGLPALEIPEIKGKVNQGDELRVDISRFTVRNLRSGEVFQAQVVPKFMRNMLMEGGLVEYYKRHKQFPLIQTVSVRG